MRLWARHHSKALQRMAWDMECKVGGRFFFLQKAPLVPHSAHQICLFVLFFDLKMVAREASRPGSKELQKRYHQVQRDRNKP